MEHLLYIANSWDGLVRGWIVGGSRESITEMEVCNMMMDDERYRVTGS